MRLDLFRQIKVSIQHYNIIPRKIRYFIRDFNI